MFKLTEGTGPDRFQLPANAALRHPAVILAPRDLRKWLTELPLANPPKAAQIMLQQLRLLIRDPQPGNKLATLLDLHGQPVSALSSTVDERLQSCPENAMPLDQLELTLVDLLRELAYGRLRIANDQIRAGKVPTAGLLYSALSMFDKAQRIELLRYQRTRLEHWALQLGIFVYAESAGLLEQPVDPGLRHATQPPSIQGLFLRGLVIDLCDPYHRRSDQIVNWQNWLGQHSGLLNIGILPQGPYAIPFDIGGEILPLAAARRGRPGPTMRYLATDRLLQALHDDAGAPNDLAQALDDLIRGRKIKEQRLSPRQRRDLPYRLRYGLRAVHARLEALIQGAATIASSPGDIRCRMIDQSRNGAAFELQGPLNFPLTVGDMSLFEAESASPGSPAVGFAARIRRLTVHDENRIEIGVEKLSGRLTPVRVIGGSTENPQERALAMIQHENGTGRQVLIGPRSLYRAGDTITVENPQIQLRLQLTELVEALQHTAYMLVETRLA